MGVHRTIPIYGIFISTLIAKYEDKGISQEDIFEVIADSLLSNESIEEALKKEFGE